MSVAEEDLSVVDECTDDDTVTDDLEFEVVDEGGEEFQIVDDGENESQQEGEQVVTADEPQQNDAATVENTGTQQHAAKLENLQKCEDVVLKKASAPETVCESSANNREQQQISLERHEKNKQQESTENLLQSDLQLCAENPEAESDSDLVDYYVLNDATSPAPDEGPDETCPMPDKKEADHSEPINQASDNMSDNTQDMANQGGTVSENVEFAETKPLAEPAVPEESGEPNEADFLEFDVVDEEYEFEENPGLPDSEKNECSDAAERDGVTTPTLDEKDAVSCSSGHLKGLRRGRSAKRRGSDGNLTDSLAVKKSKCESGAPAKRMTIENVEKGDDGNPVLDEMEHETDVIDAIVTDEYVEKEEKSPKLSAAGENKNVSKTAMSDHNLESDKSAAVDSCESVQTEELLMTVDEISDELIAPSDAESSVFIPGADDAAKNAETLSKNLEILPKNPETFSKDDANQDLSDVGDWLVLDDGDTSEWAATNDDGFQNAKPKPPRRSARIARPRIAPERKPRVSTKAEPKRLGSSHAHSLSKSASQLTAKSTARQPLRSRNEKRTQATKSSSAVQPKAEKSRIPDAGSGDSKSVSLKKNVDIREHKLSGSEAKQRSSSKRESGSVRTRSSTTQKSTKSTKSPTTSKSRHDHSGYREAVKRAVQVKRKSDTKLSSSIASVKDHSSSKRNEADYLKNHSESGNSGKCLPKDVHKDSDHRRSRSSVGTKHKKTGADVGGRKAEKNASSRPEPESSRNADSARSKLKGSSVFPVIPGPKRPQGTKDSSKDVPKPAELKTESKRDPNHDQAHSKPVDSKPIEKPQKSTEPPPPPVSNSAENVDSKPKILPPVVVKKSNPTVLGWVKSLCDLEYSVKKYTSFFCVPCRTMLPSTALWEEHMSLPAHRQNLIIWRETQTMISGGPSVFASSPAKMQEQVDKVSGVITGADYVVEVQDPKTHVPEQWVCLLCYSLCDAKDKLISHLIGSSHIVAHMETAYPKLLLPPFKKHHTCEELLSALTPVKVKVQEHCQTKGRGKLKCFVGRRFDGFESHQDQQDIEDTVLKSQMETLFQSETDFIPKFRLLHQGKSVANSYISDAPEATQKPSLVVGLQYIVEFWCPSRLCKPIYYCILCDYVSFEVLSHCACMKHTIGYFSKHYRSVYDVIVNEDGIRSCNDVRRGFEVAKSKIMAIEGWQGAVSFVIELFKGHDVFVPINAAIAKAIIRQLHLTVPDPPKKKIVPRPVAPPTESLPTPKVEDLAAKKVVSKAKKLSELPKPSEPRIPRETRRSRSGHSAVKPAPKSRPPPLHVDGPGLQPQMSPRPRQIVKRIEKKPEIHASQSSRRADNVLRKYASFRAPNKSTVFATPPSTTSRVQKRRSSERLSSNRHHDYHPSAATISNQWASSPQKRAQLVARPRSRDLVVARPRSRDLVVVDQRRHDRSLVAPPLQPVIQPIDTGFHRNQPIDTGFHRNQPIDTGFHRDHGSLSPHHDMRVAVGGGSGKKSREITLFATTPLGPRRIAQRHPSILEPVTSSTPRHSSRTRHHSGGGAARPRARRDFGRDGASPSRPERRNIDRPVARSRSPHGARYVSEVLQSATSKGRGNRAERPLSSQDLDRLQVALEAVNVSLGRPITSDDLSMLRLKLGDSMVDKLLDQVCSGSSKFQVFATSPAVSASAAPSVFSGPKQPYVVPPPSGSMARYPPPVRIASAVSLAHRPAPNLPPASYGAMSNGSTVFSTLNPLAVSSSQFSRGFTVPPPMVFSRLQYGQIRPVANHGEAGFPQNVAVGQGRWSGQMSQEYARERR